MSYTKIINNEFYSVCPVSGVAAFIDENWSGGGPAPNMIFIPKYIDEYEGERREFRLNLYLKAAERVGAWG